MTSSSISFYEDEMVLIASPRHALNRKRPVRIDDLGAERFVQHHLCPPTAHSIQQLFESHQTPFNVAAELWGFSGVKNFVQHDIGLAIVPRITALEELRSGTLTEIPVTGLDMKRQTFMIYRDARYLTDAARALLETIRSWSELPRPRQEAMLLEEANDAPLSASSA